MIRCRHLIFLGLCSLIVGQELASCPEAYAAAAQPTTTEAQPAPAPQAQDTATLSHRVTRIEGQLSGMEAAPRPVSDMSAFDWSTAIAAWAGAAVIALTGYFGTVRAGRQQAIETERLKLRHEIVRRRIEAFDQATEALWRFMDEHPVHRAHQLYTLDPFVGLWKAVAVRAGIIFGSLDLAEDIYEECMEFRERCEALSACIEETFGEARVSVGTAEEKEQAADSVLRAHGDVVTRLGFLQIAVDQAAEKRIQGLT